MVSRWVPGGFHVLSRWFPGGFQVVSRLYPGGIQVISRWIPFPGGRDQRALLGSVSPLSNAFLAGQKSSSVVKFCWELAGDPLVVVVGGGVCPDPADARLPFRPLVDNWGDSAQHWIPISRTSTIRNAPSSSRWRDPFLLHCGLSELASMSSAEYRPP